MNLEDQQSRPRKRQRLSPDRPSSPCRQILLEEIDLEIALRERLASAVESRITWALLVQQSLEKDLHYTNQDNSAEFRNAALDALEAIEAPCHPIFTRDVKQHRLRLAQAPDLPPPPSKPASASTAAPPAPGPPSAYATRHRGAARAARPPPRKLLFLRSTAAHGAAQLAKLACPDCARTDFSSLQGLLNHCRLSHRREFGSHDECVQRCAVLVERPEDQAWVVAHGTEVAGITIPGLRRLFELAVGGGREVVPLLSAKTQNTAPDKENSAEEATLSALQPAQATSQAAPGHVTRTLGHHADSPALAPFLGRAPKQRVIHAYDEDQPVDIFGGAGTAQKKAHWRMPYPHRNRARAALDEVVEPPALSAAPPAAAPPPEGQRAAPHLRGPVSRFHMMARVSVQDRSLWIPPSRRMKSREDHTHRWRLEVSAPSYSLPLTSFLKSMSVSCATDPPPSTLVQPIVIDKPPFIVTSTTDRPFLARITFSWAGAEGQNPPLDIEHWVELDPMRSSQPVKGEEQVFDVALDRATELLPVGDEPKREVGWDMDDVADKTDHGGQSPIVREAREEDEEEVPDYAVRLRALLPHFPLTLRDAKGRLSRELPYTLVSTPTQLRNLVDGRRKAIEWGRAHALREAYAALCASEPWKDGRADVPLTTGDVFRWLEDEGLFPRDTKRVLVESTETRRARRQAVKADERPDEYMHEDYCRSCGLHYTLHPAASGEHHVQSSVATEGVKIEPTFPGLPIASPAPVTACPGFNAPRPLDLPVIDVNRFLSVSSSVDGNSRAPCGLHPTLFSQVAPHRSSSVLGSPSDDTARALLAAAEPSMVRAVHALARLGAPAPPLRNDGRDAAAHELAPSALLALAVQSFARTLVRRGLDELRRDEAGARAQTRARRKVGAGVARLLTPAHVARGVVRAAPSVAACGALVLCAAPVGMALPAVPADAAGDAADPGAGGDL